MICFFDGVLTKVQEVIRKTLSGSVWRLSWNRVVDGGSKAMARQNPAIRSI